MKLIFFNSRLQTVEHPLLSCEAFLAGDVERKVLRRFLLSLIVKYKCFSELVYAPANCGSFLIREAVDLTTKAGLALCDFFFSTIKNLARTIHDCCLSRTGNRIRSPRLSASD